MHSLNASIEYGKSRNRYIIWYALGSTSIGNVPPEPATCITSRTIPRASPILPNATVTLYIKKVNTKLENAHATQ